MIRKVQADCDDPPLKTRATPLEQSQGKLLDPPIGTKAGGGRPSLSRRGSEQLSGCEEERIHVSLLNSSVTPCHTCMLNIHGVSVKITCAACAFGLFNGIHPLVAHPKMAAAVQQQCRRLQNGEHGFPQGAHVQICIAPLLVKVDFDSRRPMIHHDLFLVGG